MRKEVMTNKKYLVDRLDSFIKESLINSFSISEERSDKSEPYFRVNIDIKEGVEVSLFTDLHETMGATINGYYRDETDYLIGSFEDTIDWYLDIVKSISQKNYRLEIYSSGNKVICKYLKLEIRGKNTTIGDFRNHFKIFAKKTTVDGGEL